MIEKKLDNSPIHYYISETKGEQTILFVHAAFADHSQYDKQAGYFTDKFTVITLDLIGHGKSVTATKGAGIEKTSDYIRQILITENIEKVHLVGVSIGAILIQDFANFYPEMTASLSCFGGYDINNFCASLQKGNNKAQILMMLKAMLSIKWFAQSNKLISAYTPQAQEAFYHMNIRFRKKSFMYLAGLNCLVNKHITAERHYPLLIGCGDKDIPMQLKATEQWHHDEPKSCFKIFKNAGHLVNMDVPDEFNEALERFIKEMS